MKRSPLTLHAPGTLGEQLAFFDPPTLCPVWPSPNTLAEQALNLMLAEKSIDHRDFIDLTGSWRLAAYIEELRNLGWPIMAAEISAPTPRCQTRKISRYSMPLGLVAKALSSNGRKCDDAA